METYDEFYDMDEDEEEEYDNWDEISDDPCYNCGPACPHWGGDGICMLQIRAQAEQERYESMMQTWYGRAVLRLEDFRARLVALFTHPLVWVVCQYCHKPRYVFGRYIGNHDNCYEVPF